jgi:hypothetical protein
LAESDGGVLDDVPEESLSDEISGSAELVPRVIDEIQNVVVLEDQLHLASEQPSPSHSSQVRELHLEYVFVSA